MDLPHSLGRAGKKRENIVVGSLQRADFKKDKVTRLSLVLLNGPVGIDSIVFQSAPEDGGKSRPRNVVGFTD
jgi:hypothetical protein